MLSPVATEMSEDGDGRIADAQHIIGLAVKRTLDVTVATVLLLACLPLFVAIALLVRLSSPGPVFFRQQRLGRDGELFWFYKFRTMYADNDPSDHLAYYQQLVRGEAEPVGGRYKLAYDRRVTPVGRRLRRFSLDELPQLINVINGDMSLVGPRPPIPYEMELYGPRELRRLSVKPGLTGMWQVSGRSTLSFHQMVDLDLAYIQRWSIWLDLWILVQTPWAVLTGRGAC